MRQPKFWQLLGLLALANTLLALATQAAGYDRSHALLDAVLKQRVKMARVDYSGLKAHPEDLDRYLNQISGVSRGDYQAWTESERIAFLCNAYNAYTLKLILDHYPLKSIKDIGSLLSGPWDQPVVKLFGESMTLNTVEHKILRKEFNEPRIHFALVCAAKGCPPLRSEAYTGDRLKEQLSDQAKLFLAESSKNRVAASERVIYLSPIFKWYGEDFGNRPSAVLSALKPYWPTPPKDGYEKFKIRYTEYDWSLNE